MMNRLRTVGLVGLLLATPQVSGAQAVSSSDFQTLMNRLERIERRLNAAEGAGTTGAVGGGSTADLELRMQDLEHEGSELNGGMERLGNAVERLAKRVDDITKDFDLRLQDLEKSGGGTASAPVPAVVHATEHAAETTEKSAEKAEATETAGEHAAKEEHKAEDKPAESAVPAGLAPKDLYDKAYSYLTATDYATSKVWFAEFIKRFPKDKLADNAHYWLGEIALVQNNPQEALVNFKAGLTAFPKGAKAPANLYKMGIALQALEQIDFAKGAWGKLIKDYPKSAEATKAKEKLKLLAAQGKKG